MGGRVLFIDFELSYCFLFCLDNEKPLPIRSGYEQKKHIAGFTLDAKNKRFDVVTQELNSAIGMGVALVTNILPVAAIKESNHEVDRYKQLVDVDVSFVNGESFLISKFKDSIYSVRSTDLIKELVKKLVDVAKEFLKEDIASIVFSTSLELNENCNASILMLLSQCIEACGIQRTRFIPYSDVLFSYYEVTPADNKRVLLLHFDSTQCSFCVKEFKNHSVETLLTFSKIDGGYQYVLRELANNVLKEYETRNRCKMFSEKVRTTPSLLHKKMKDLINEVERMEIDLRMCEEYEIILGRGKTAVSVVISKDLYLEWKSAIMKQLTHPIEMCLKEKDLTVESIHQVLVEGDCANDSLFQEEIRFMFKDRCLFDSLPEEVIGCGLCLMEIRPKKRFVDTNFGLLIAPCEFVPFLSKGSSVPCQCRKDFTTPLDNQEEFMTYLVCKESIDSQEFSIIDTFYVSQLHRTSAKELDFEFVFQMEESGILSVSCYEQLFESEILSICSYAQTNGVWERIVP